jgi:hypothetical protein
LRWGQKHILLQLASTGSEGNLDATEKEFLFNQKRPCFHSSGLRKTSDVSLIGQNLRRCFCKGNYATAGCLE